MSRPRVTKTCIGYKGHECGEPFETGNASISFRCPPCQKAHVKLWHRAYCKGRYDREHFEPLRQARRVKSRQVFTPWKLQRLRDEKFVVAVTAIIRDEVLYVSAR